MGNRGEVAPPRDQGSAERGKVLVDDHWGSGHGPPREADASDCLVMFNEVGKSPHGGRNILADAFDESCAHGQKERSGRGVRQETGLVGQVLVEDGVSVSKVSARAKECLPRAGAALGQVKVLNHGRKGERVNTSMEGFRELDEFGALFLVRDRAQDETQIVPHTTGKFVEGGGSTTITLAAKGVIKTSKLGSMIGVRRGEVIVVVNLGTKHREVLSKGIASTKAHASINVAGQAAPASLSVSKEGSEGRG